MADPKLCVRWGGGGVEFQKRGSAVKGVEHHLPPCHYHWVNSINHKLVPSTWVLYIWTKVKLCNVCLFVFQFVDRENRRKTLRALMRKNCKLKPNIKPSLRFETQDILGDKCSHHYYNPSSMPNCEEVHRFFEIIWGKRVVLFPTSGKTASIGWMRWEVIK